MAPWASSWREFVDAVGSLRKWSRSVRFRKIPNVRVGSFVLRLLPWESPSRGRVS